MASLPLGFISDLKGCFPGKFSSTDHEIGGNHPNYILTADVCLKKCPWSHEKGKWSPWPEFKLPNVKRLGSHKKWQQDGKWKGEWDRVGLSWNVCQQCQELKVLPFIAINMCFAFHSLVWICFCFCFSHKLAVSSTRWDSLRDLWNFLKNPKCINISLLR